MAYYDEVKSQALIFHRHCLAGGFLFDVSESILEVSPANAIDDEMTQLIKYHKLKLIEIIKG